MVINGTIKNVSVSGNIESSNNVRAGGIVSAIKDGSVINCVNRAKVMGGQYVGGICAYSNNSSIKNCINESSSIIATGSLTYTLLEKNWNGSGNVGGIIGYTTNKTIIEKCVNKGNIDFKTTLNIPTVTGGISGWSEESSIIQSKNLATINSAMKNGTIDGNGAIGGISGATKNSTISECYNSNNITSLNSSGKYSCSNLGGIVGYSMKSNIKNSYNIGGVNGNTNIGGLVGYFESSNINNCYNSSSNIVGNKYFGNCLGNSLNSKGIYNA